jgi:GMP synthase (glutamine-hydrolysing)
VAVLTTPGDVTGPTRRILVIENEESARPAMLAAAIADVGFDLDVRSMAAGDPVPDRLDGVAGVVLLGATYDVRDAPQQPHLNREMDLIRHAVDEGIPALGICLGGQLAAEALGGSVQRGPDGPEIGWVTVRPTPEGARDPVASTLGRGAPLFQWHHDVFTPPPGATPILTAEGWPHQGFRVGSVWGVQSHPEIDPELLAVWCRSPDGSEDLEANGVDGERLIEDAARYSGPGRSLLDAWCRVVASSRAT